MACLTPFRVVSVDAVRTFSDCVSSSRYEHGGALASSLIVDCIHDESKRVQYSPFRLASWLWISARVLCSAARPRFTPSSGTYDRNFSASPFLTMAKNSRSSVAGDGAAGLAEAALLAPAGGAGFAEPDWPQATADAPNSKQHIRRTVVLICGARSSDSWASSQPFSWCSPPPALPWILRQQHCPIPRGVSSAVAPKPVGTTLPAVVAARHREPHGAISAPPIVPAPCKALE